MSKRYAKQHKTPKRLRKPSGQQSRRLDERSIVGLGQIFPGFDEWYRESYDERGRCIGMKEW